MPPSFTEKEVTKAEIRQRILAIQSLIQWSEVAAPRFKDCITCGTPTFESVLSDAASEACQFFKDLLL